MSFPFQIVDAHTHFFSHSWLVGFFAKARDRFGPDDDIEALASMLGWQLPPSNPHDLGERWVAELDKHGVEHQVLFAGNVQEVEALTAARNAFPDRLSGYAMIDPTRPDARQQTIYALNIMQMSGIVLFPAMHHFRACDDSAQIIFDEALSENVPVFIHFGGLKIPIYDKLEIADNIDLQYSDPRDLGKVAQEFSQLNFIIPHFGCGRFDEALSVAAANNNIYFDTASSNSWIKEPLTLARVFERALEVLGPERILFGTDSSFFPRGWRQDIFDTQFSVLEELGLSNKEMSLIFGGNIKRLLKRS